MRELKALEIAARCKIERKAGAYRVPAQSKPAYYRVMLRPEVSCECDDFALTHNACKHVIACRLVEGREGVALAPPMDTSEIPKRKTYKQDWPAYSRAQQQEKDRYKSFWRTCAAAWPNLRVMRTAGGAGFDSPTASSRCASRCGPRCPRGDSIAT